jgi:ATP-binding cassette subfamily F protein 3
MILFTASEIRKYFSQDPVLDGISFQLSRGERVALVGPNGSGKTTLLNIISGQLEADGGELQMHGNGSLAFLPQRPGFPDGTTLWELAMEPLEPLREMGRRAEQLASEIAEDGEGPGRERLDEEFDLVQHRLQELDGYHLDYRVERVLDGLGFEASSYQQPAEQLSGGQQNRLLLARLLLDPADLILLDEPSNHLDLEATEWLEQHLLGCRQTILMVSHDRQLLDRLATRTLELFQGTVVSYKGNYSSYVEQKAQRLEIERKTYQRQQDEIARLEDFVRRHHHGKKHAQAEDRRKKLERIEPVDAPREVPSSVMSFPEPSRSGDIVFRAEGISKSFDGGRPLFEDLQLDVERGQKWGILGVNGSGKTTLLRCLVDQLPVDSGQVSWGRGVKIGYFDQKLEDLEDDLPVVEAIRPDHKQFTEQQRRDLLARFGIQDDVALQRVGSLSGGERCRVALARLAALDANLLVLDEPTNHLDLWARASLEKSLKQFKGTVLVVTHDRFFLNQVVDRLLVLEADRTRLVHGNYDTYAHMVRQGLASTPAGEDSSRPVTDSPRPETKDVARRRRFPYRKVQELETEIAECQSRINQLYEQLADPDCQRDGDRVKHAQQELAGLHQELVRLEEHWEESVELNG